MEDFRIKLNKKTRIYALLFFMSIAGIVLLAAFGKNNSGFNASSGFFGGMAAVSGVNFFKMRKALRDDNVLRQVFIAKTDERTISIERETSAAMFNIIFICLSAATIISNFFSSTVSSTLSICLAFIALTYGVVSAYFNKKM